jgi:hypothetical protein
MHIRGAGSVDGTPLSGKKALEFRRPANYIHSRSSRAEGPRPNVITPEAHGMSKSLELARPMIR